MNQIDKIKIIANRYVENKTDKRGYFEVFEHMKDWHSKGWLSDAFVEGAYAAIDDGKRVEFQYVPGQHYLYLAGTEEAFENVLGGK